MKRRGFLGALSGAAVAGPSIAKNIIPQTAEGTMSIMSAGSVSWLGNKDTLRRQLAGKWLPWELEDFRQHHTFDRMDIVEARCAALRSVSKLQMRVMVVREKRKLQNEANNSSLLSRLLRIEAE